MKELEDILGEILSYEPKKEVTITMDVDTIEKILDTRIKSSGGNYTEQSFLYEISKMSQENKKMRELLHDVYTFMREKYGASYTPLSLWIEDGE